MDESSTYQEELELLNFDSDDDIQVVQIEPAKIDVVTLSDDNPPKTNFLTSIANPIVSNVSANKIEKDVDLQIAIQEKVKLNYQKFNKLNKGSKQIGKIMPKLEPPEKSPKHSKNDKYYVLNDLHIQDEQIKNQALANDLSRSNDNLNVEVDCVDFQENDQSMIVINPVAIKCNRLQNISTNQNVVETNEQQSTPCSKTGLNVEPLMSMEYDNLQDNSINENVEENDPLTIHNSKIEETESNVEANESQTTRNSKILEGTRLNVVSPTSTKHSNLENVLLNELDEPRTETRSNIDESMISIISPMVLEHANLEDIATNQNVNELTESQTDQSSPKIENTTVSLPSTSSSSPTFPELPSPSKHNEIQKMNSNRNPIARQYTKNNFYPLQNMRPMIDQPVRDTSKFEKSEYLDPLLSVIVEEGYPDVRYLTDFHLAIVRKLVAFEIDNIPSTETSVPRFLSSYVKCGVILVKSADANSQAWLQSIVPNLCPGPDVKLTVVSLQELNRTYKIKVRVVHDPSSEEQILTRIQKQNPDVNMRSWKLLSVYRFKGGRAGVILFMSVPSYYFKLLKDKGFKLHYGLYQINVELKEDNYKKMH